MKLLRKPAAVAVATLALAALPTVAEAHDGTHPFANCTEAYENGYANIAKGNEHYGTHLDRDQDGIGCDSPPADFVPATDEDTPADTTDPKTPDLAETGGTSTTPYLAAGGATILLAGGGVVLVSRRRRNTR